MNESKLIDTYMDALHEAIEIVESRQNRNNAVPLENMFIHGIQDLVFMLWMKIARIRGLELDVAVGRVIDTIRSEALDIINYAAFLVGMIDLMTKEGSDNVNASRHL